MAPEQVRGEPVDSRSDIFALGCVLYEMLTGERAFKRDTTPEIMTAILREEPPSFAESGAQVPPDLAKTVSHCLEKNPERRFQSAADIAFALGSESEVAESPVVPSEISRPRTWAMPLLAIAGTLASLSILLAGLLWMKPSGARNLSRYRFSPFVTDAQAEKTRWPTCVAPHGRQYRPTRSRWIP